MIVKRLILKKILQSGYVAEFNLVKREGQYEAALFLNGKAVAGPPCHVRSRRQKMILPIGWETGRRSG